MIRLEPRLFKHTRTLVFGVSRPGMARYILNIRFSCMHRTYRADLRLMCIFIISRFQTTFSHEMTVISEIYCQNLKDKTSILSLVQIIIMCYCRIHAHDMHERYLEKHFFSALMVK